MPAQGHVIRSSSPVSLDAGNGHHFAVRRLQSDRVMRDEKQNVKGSLQCLTYYFFVGHDEMTNDHLQRTFIDMKDRLLHGMDQRWAYVSVSTYFGQLPWLQGKTVTEQEADEKLAAFTREFASRQIDWKMVKAN